MPRMTQCECIHVEDGRISLIWVNFLVVSRRTVFVDCVVTAVAQNWSCIDDVVKRVFFFHDVSTFFPILVVTLLLVTV